MVALQVEQAAGGEAEVLALQLATAEEVALQVDKDQHDSLATAEELAEELALQVDKAQQHSLATAEEVALQV